MSEDGQFAELYSTDPSEFVPLRNKIAKSYREQGDREAAAPVSALRRPTKVSAALNKVVHERRDLVVGLIEAGNVLHDAQVELLQTGSRESIASALSQFRDQVESLADVVASNSGDAVRSEITMALDQAGSDAAR